MKGSDDYGPKQSLSRHICTSPKSAMEQRII
jgi:hypothetical protein